MFHLHCIHVLLDIVFLGRDEGRVVCRVDDLGRFEQVLLDPDAVGHVVVVHCDETDTTTSQHDEHGRLS